MDLKTMQALANRNGLVPMEIKRAFAPYRVGDIAGFPPETALDYATSEPPTAVVLGYGARGQFKPAGVEPLDHDASGRKGGSLPGRQKPVKKEDDGLKNPPLIPADWANLHVLKKIKLAEGLGWVKPDKDALPEGTKVSDLASEFIAMAVKVRDDEAAFTAGASAAATTPPST